MGGLMNNLGRRTILISVDIFGIIGSICYVLSLYYEESKLLLIGRIISGVVTGINAVIVPLYIKEMSPDA